MAKNAAMVFIFKLSLEIIVTRLSEKNFANYIGAYGKSLSTESRYVRSEFYLEIICEPQHT